MKLLLALWLALPASAQPAPPPACAPGDDPKLCAEVGEILPALLDLWDMPYEIPKALPPLEEKWKPVKAALADPRRQKGSKGLEDLLALGQATLDKFPTVEQYRFLAARAKANACWFQALMGDEKVSWDSSLGEAGAGGPSGAFVEAGEPGSKAAFAAPDVLRDLFGLVPNPAPNDGADGCAPGAPRAADAAAARGGDLTRKAGADARALVVDKTDDLAAPPPARAAARLDTKAVPAASAAAASPEPGIPGLGFVGRALEAAYKAVAPAPAKDPVEEARRAREDGAAMIGAAALAELRRPSGDPAAAARLSAILALPASAERDARLRAELGGLDPAFAKLSFDETLARIKEKRAASCKGAKKCLEAAPNAKEYAAAEDDASKADPVLGLYLVARAEHRLTVKAQLAAGVFPLGAKLEPWETGEDLPAKTVVTVAAEAPAGGGERYLGLSFALPDGSSRFEGARGVKDGLERVVESKGAGGTSSRSVVVYELDRSGRETALRSEETLYDAAGHKLRVTTTAGKGSVVQRVDFNKDAKDDGDVWRSEIVETAGGKTRTTIRDANAGFDTTIGYDGAVEIRARRASGLPLDGSETAKCAPKETCWTVKTGRMKDGKLELESVEMADGSIERGKMYQGRFFVSEKELGDCDRKTAPYHHCTLFYGKPDDAQRSFNPIERLGPDGKGEREEDGVIAALEDDGKKTVSCQVSAGDLNPPPPSNDELSAEGRVNERSRINGMIDALPSARSAAEKMAECARLPKERALPLSLWLADKLSQTDSRIRSANGVRGDKAYLVSAPPFAQVEWVLRAPDAAPKASPKETTQLEWRQGTEFHAKKPGLVLTATDARGFPFREYLPDGTMRQWETSGERTKPGLVTSGSTCEKVELVPYDRREKWGEWTGPCTGQWRDNGACAWKQQAGDCHVVATKPSVLGGLSGDISDAVPGMNLLGKTAEKGVYTIVGGLQEDLQVTHVSRGGNMRLATIANMRNGFGSNDDALRRIKDDPELSESVDENVREDRHKGREAQEYCDQVHDDAKCGAYRARLDAVPVADEERVAWLAGAYTSEAAIDRAAAGGSPVLYALGGLGLAGKMAATSLPSMGLTEGLGALGKIDKLGGWAEAARVAHAVLSLDMSAGWIVGSVDNMGGGVQAGWRGEVAAVFKSGVRAAGDVGLAHMGAAAEHGRAETEPTLRALETKRVELEKLSEAAGEGTADGPVVAAELPAVAPAVVKPELANTQPAPVEPSDAHSAKTAPGGADPPKTGAPAVPEYLKNGYKAASDLNAKAGQGSLYRSRDGGTLVKVFKLGEKSASREAVDALVAHNEDLQRHGVPTVKMKAVEVAPGKWGIEMPFVEGESMKDFVDRDWNEDSGHSELGKERLKKAKAILDKIDGLTAKDPAKPAKDNLTDHRGRVVLDDGTIISDNEDFANFIIDKSGDVINIDPLNMDSVMKRGPPDPASRGPRGVEPDLGRAPPPEQAKTPEPPQPGKGGVLEGQKGRREAFETENFAGESERDLKKLPGRIPARLRPAIETVYKLFGDRYRCFDLMQQFEIEVAGRAKAKGESLEAAREQVLKEWEQRHGFKSVIELQDKSYDPPEWHAMLRDGAMFLDPTFKGNSKTREGHGSETHRLQWHLVMRAMEADPAAFGGVAKASDLFKGLGEIDYAKLDWNDTGIDAPLSQDLWRQLFDTFDQNWSSPEWVYPKHNYWPGLGAWD